jgi:hypothetical protein
MVLSHSTWMFNGSLNGYSYPLGEISDFKCSEELAQAKVTVRFSGGLDSLEKGSFRAILDGATSPGIGSEKDLRADLEIIQGTGNGGLEGICGKGSIIGSVGPGSFAEAEYRFELLFGEECPK